MLKKWITALAVCIAVAASDTCAMEMNKPKEKRVIKSHALWLFFKNLHKFSEREQQCFFENVAQKAPAVPVYLAAFTNNSFYAQAIYQSVSVDGKRNMEGALAGAKIEEESWMNLSNCLHKPHNGSPTNMRLLEDEFSLVSLSPQLQEDVRNQLSRYGLVDCTTSWGTKDPFKKSKK